MDIMMRENHSSRSHNFSRNPNHQDRPRINTQHILCKYWANGRCMYGDQCRFLHSWYRSSNIGGFSMVARLEGHKKAVCGISLPSGSNKLYTASRDGTVRVWDCENGKCDQVINLGGQVGSFTTEGNWVFIGLHGLVKVWNLSASSGCKSEFCLNGPVGQVYALAVYKDLLIAGVANGDILVWKGSFEENPFKLVATLKAHKKGVVCLHVGHGNRLYSGSMDNTVQVWDLVTLQCRQTLKGHSDVVMSMLSWDQLLVTCSLDHTMNVWGVKDGGALELMYTHEESCGIIKVFGMLDASGKPVLFCSCNDNCVRLCELDSFADKGRIFAKQEIREIQLGPGGLFFTGDATGMVTVWGWQGEPSRQGS